MDVEEITLYFNLKERPKLPKGIILPFKSSFIMTNSDNNVSLNSIIWMLSESISGK